MKMRLGRNDPCHCGSGKKYKKCCLIVEEAAAACNPLNQETPLMESFSSGLIEGSKLCVPRSAVFGGQRWRWVGQDLFGRPERETFSDFLLWLMRETLGSNWVKEQRARRPAEQHVVVRWLDEFRNLAQHPLRIRKGLYVKSGPMAAAQQLAYDLFILRVVGQLPDRLVNRLKDRSEFQGARYEIAIASGLARADFEIAWLGDSGAGRRCEFVAKHIPSQTEIAVEAKSRQRPGVLHREGSFDDTAELKAGIRNLYESALNQGLPGKPLIIFIDLNLPTDNLPEPDPETLSVPSDFVGWSREIKAMLQADWAIEGRLPSSGTLVAVTNFCPHFGPTDAIVPPGVFEFFPSPNPRNPIMDQRVVDDLFNALRQYAIVPSEI